jgi:hypothetical protein
MKFDDRPEWMKELGLSPRFPKDRYVIPPPPAGLRIESELDPVKAARLVTEFTALIADTTEPDQLEALRIRLLDTMTANRLSMLQASKLVALVLRKIEGTAHEMRRIMPDGTDVPVSSTTREGK